MAQHSAIVVERWGDESVLQLKTVPRPTPAAGEVLVKIMAVGVNPVDTYIRTGTYAVKPTLPYTPGSDGAGVVESVGEGVTKTKVGDRVFMSKVKGGTYAQHTLADEGAVHPLPDTVSFEQGAAINVAYKTAYRALFLRAKVQKGQTVFVHGASGGVGMASVQLAKAAGCVVIGSGGSEAAEAALGQAGCDHTVNHKADGYMAKVKDATDGKGVDVILEMLANVNLGNDLTVLAKGGCVAIIGNRGTVEINPRDLMAREASIIGVKAGAFTADETAAAVEHICAGLVSGDLAPVVSSPTYSLADAGAAHTEVIARTTLTPGKLILLPW